MQLFAVYEILQKKKKKEQLKRDPYRSMPATGFPMEEGGGRRGCDSLLPPNQVDEQYHECILGS